MFYDFTFSPPKSVSIAALVCDDARIVGAHEGAVQCALARLEPFASTRVRKNGQRSDRTTGKIVAAVFRHDTRATRSGRFNAVSKHPAAASRSLLRNDNRSLIWKYSNC